MPRTRSLAWSELKLGVLTITAIVIAALTIFLVMGGQGFFWQRYSLKTRFGNVAGLKPGSPVRVAGKEVGSVKAVEFAGDQVDIVFEVNKTVRERITTESVARLGSVSLLGEGAVDITAASHGTPIADWGYVPAGRPPSQISDITDTASQGIEEISGLVHDMRAGRGTVGKLVTDERLYAELRQFATSANDVTRAIGQGRGTIGRLINDRQTVDALNASLRNLEDLTRRINAGEGSLGKLLKDEAFSQSLTGATSNLRTLTDRLNRGEGTAGKLMTDPALFNRMNELTTRFDQVVSRLNDGEGTMGQLLKDRQLYENMNKTVMEFQALLSEIKRDPKRYLNVKVSIF
jgi:phospholipid/cholesterol/gamma-HCH transport system substrate-binding protein